jgi:sec-independent protein translocase protein TatC
MSADESVTEGFLSHLVALRDCLLRAAVCVLAVFVFLIPFSNRLYARFAAPLLDQLPSGAQMISIKVAGPFLTPLKLAFVTALVISMPWVIYQLWRFVAPALYRHEVRLAKPLLLSAIVLFYAGCAFAFYVVLPGVFAFMGAVNPEGVAWMTDIGEYLDFVVVTFFAFGLCFELPVAVMILVMLGWVSIAQLREARAYVIVGVFVVAAVVTPPDVVSQLLLAIPMWLLYELGIIVAQLSGIDKPRSAGEPKTS